MTPELLKLKSQVKETENKQASNIYSMLEGNEIYKEKKGEERGGARGKESRPSTPQGSQGRPH